MFEFFGDLIVGFFQFLAEIAIEGRRERRARERGAVVGLMRVQSGEVRGLSRHWRRITASVDARRLMARNIDLHVLGVRKLDRPMRFLERMSGIAPDATTTVLELRTQDAVVEWSLPTQDTPRATSGLTLPVRQ